MTSITPATSVKPRRRRWLRILNLFLSLILSIIVVLAVGATLVVRSAFPQTSGTIHLAGPYGTITITRDLYGVPHIFANDDHDAFFAQGYVTAQDRLWQMEFNRRVAAGRLSEILGPSTADADAFLRTLGLKETAQSDVDKLSPALHAQMAAYADGVNAYIDSHKNSLPLEFRILGFTPEPWHISDSIAYGKVVALSLDTTWYNKITRMDIMSQGGAAALQGLFPAYPNDNPTLIDSTGTNEIPPATSETPFTPAAMQPTSLTPQQQQASASVSSRLIATLNNLRNMLGNAAAVEGSNDWVVSGAHTTTGKPIVANDPHLGINYPAIWYEIAIQGATYNEIGFSFPGVPDIIIGHNDHVAWGVTNGSVDDTDLYIEKFSADGSTYLYNGQQLPVQTRAEVIHVKGAPDVHITVRTTNHGPIINDLFATQKHSPTPIALQWTALRSDYNFSGFFELGAAQNLDQLQNAMKDISISQNFVFADTQGNIGYRLSGMVPIRPRANGWLPVDGTISANDWTGMVPFDQMPHLLNPPSGIIWTANNRIVPDTYQYYVTSDWDMGFRAKRIEQLLTAKATLSPDDIAAIQNDVVSIPGQQLSPMYVAATQGIIGNGPATAQKLLQGWDGSMPVTSAAAAFYEVTTSKLIQDLAQKAISGDVYKEYRDNQDYVGQILFARNQLVNPQPPFLNGVADRNAAIVKAENEAYDFLKQYFNSTDVSTWQWGKLHLAHFDHPLTAVSILKLVFPNQTVDRPGDGSTVNVGGDSGFTYDSYRQHDIPSMREIIDMGNLDASRFVTSTGESGEPFAPHNFDLMPLWNGGQYQQMYFSQSVVNAHAEATLTLEP